MSYPSSGNPRRAFSVLLAATILVAVFLSACSFDLSDLTGFFDKEVVPPASSEPTDFEIIFPSSEPTEATTEPDVYPYMEYSSPIFAGSDQRYLTANDVENLSPVELLLARSEIYARHGVIFANADLATYFAHQSWYAPAVAEDAFDSTVFNDQEDANVQLLQVYEKMAAGGYAPSSNNPYMPYYDPDTELLLAKSSTTKLTSQDLAGYNADQLIIIRNQIIAQHGYTFGDRELMEYFLQCSWYRPSTAPGRTDLVQGMTSLEYENMDFIHRYEQNPQSVSGSTGSGSALSTLDTSLTYSYENEFYSIQLPVFWKEYAVIEPSVSEHGVPFVRFSEGPDNEKYGIGHLFTLMLKPVEEFYDYPQYKELGIISNGTNTYRFIILYPSDVQFSDENRELYSKMTSSSFVEKTLQLKNGYEFID